MTHTTTQQSPFGTPQIHPKTALSPDDDHNSHLIHPSLDLPHLPPQTASGSNQPYCHSILSGRQTNSQTQTFRWDRQQLNSNSSYAMLIVS